MQVVPSKECIVLRGHQTCVWIIRVKEEGEVQRTNWVWKEQASGLQIGTETSCSARTINQKSQNGRPQTEYSPQPCLVWPTRHFKNRRFPIKKKKSGFPSSENSEDLATVSLPTASHQLGLSRRRVPGERLIFPAGHISHHSPTITLHTLYVHFLNLMKNAP